MSDPLPSRLDSSLSPSARWNFAPGPPLATLRCDSGTGVTTLTDARGVRQRWHDPLAALAWLAGDGLADQPSAARWIGYLSYDLGRLFETIPAIAADDLSLPLFVFMLHVGSDADPTPASVKEARGTTSLTSTFSRGDYEAAVQRAVEYIAAGDIFQVNLSQRFSAGFADSPAAIYHRLRRDSPAPYGALLDYGDHALVCNSPELFLRIAPQPDGSRRILTRPVKGTRPRLAGMDEELRRSIKDQAELNMIVDLERNDLGRICRIGSVRVTEPRIIEAHPTVYHGVASVEGVLRQDVAFVDILRATFPGGSITGAPKIRAMQIIEELEPVRRGPYCGAIGYIDASGAIEFNIAIRTIIMKAGRAHIPVGGGIVADSTPAAEYEETLVKAQAIFAALGIAPDAIARR